MLGVNFRFKFLFWNFVYFFNFIDYGFGGKYLVEVLVKGKGFVDNI